LVGIRAESLSVDEVVAAVRVSAAGGLVVFVGSVRDLDGGRAVERLGYTAHPSAEAQLRAVAESVAARYPAVAVAAVHRVGDLDIGDVAVVVAVSCPHRGEAFDAARALIDELKTTVPIWKHQVFSDGSDEWVGTP
jgi:molybdopterin synthase catalytic subunit